MGHTNTHEKDSSIVLDELSKEMAKPKPQQEVIRDLLDEIKVHHPDVYQRLKNDSTSLVYEAERHILALKATVTGITLPEFVLGNEEVMKRLQKYGVIKDGRALIENPEIKEEFEEYIDLINFIETTPRDARQAITDKAGLVERYLRILAPTNTRFIEGSRFLEIMYAEALYEDIIARGYIHKRDGVTGEYRIVCPHVIVNPDGSKTYAEKDLKDDFPNHEYLTLLEKRNINDMLDMMAVGSIITKDYRYDGLEVVGQMTMIHTILSKHKILGPDGKNIQKDQLLLVDWETIKPQIIAKRNEVVDGSDDKVSMQAYQELSYLLDFIENKDYLDPESNLKKFQYANVYRKTFLASKQFIDAGGGEIGSITEENIFDKIGEIAAKNQGAGIMFALFALITGFKKTALTAAFFSLFGANIANVGSDTLKAGQEIAGNWNKETLEILDPQDIRYDITPGTGISKAAINPQLETLYTANEGARDNGGLETGNTLTHTVSNAKLAKVFEFLSGNDGILAQDFSTSPNMAAQIHGALGTGATISAGSFASRVPESEYANISPEDVIAVLALMEKNIKEDGDTSFGDVIHKGIDPLKMPYVPVNFGFSGESAQKFENNINAILAQARENSTTRKQASKVEALREQISSIFVGGVLPTTLGNAGQIVQSGTILGEIGETQAAVQALSLIPDGDLIIGGVDYKAQLIEQIKLYKDYSQVSDVLQAYDGIGAQVVQGTNTLKTNVQIFAERRLGLSTGNPDDIDVLLRELDTDIALFADPTKVGIPLENRTVDISTNPLFADLLRRHQEIKKQLESEKQQLEAQKQAIQDSISARLRGATGGTLIIELSPTEKGVYQQMFIDGKMRDLDTLSTEINSLATHIGEGNTQSITNLSVFIGTYGASYQRVSGIYNAIKDIPVASGSLQEQAKESLRQVVEGAGATLFARIQSELTQAFAKQKEVYDKVHSITPTATNTPTELTRQVQTLTDIEGEFKSGVLGVALDYDINGSTFPPSEAEKAFKKAQEYFGNGFTIPGSNITTLMISQEIRTKKQALADIVKSQIDTAANLDTLVALYNGGVINMVDSLNQALGTKAEVRRKAEDLIQAKIDSLSSVSDIVAYTDGTIPFDLGKGYKDHRSMFEWTLRNQPGEILGFLEIDKKLAEKLKSTLESEITGLTLDSAGLAKAKIIAEKMEWMPNQSTLGRWSEIFGENFTEFTGLFEASGVRQSFDTRLEEIREALMNQPLLLRQGPPPTYAYQSILNALNSHALGLSGNLGTQIEIDRDSLTLKALFEKYKTAIPTLSEAYKNEFLISN